MATWRVALINRGDMMASVSANWEILGLKGKHKVRDLWVHMDLGSFRDAFRSEVASHSTVMLRIAR